MTEFNDFYPRPPRGGRPPPFEAWAIDLHISIHALREEGDCPKCGSTYLAHGISIHALREEGDLKKALFDYSPTYFYPRPPRGGRQMPYMLLNLIKKFLSTPSARRATSDSSNPNSLTRIFLSTPSARRATKHLIDVDARKRISIHALREEGDQLTST